MSDDEWSLFWDLGSNNTEVFVQEEKPKNKYPIARYLALYAGLKRKLRMDSSFIKWMMRKILRFEELCLDVALFTESLQHGLRAQLLMWYNWTRFDGYYPPKYTRNGVVFSPCKEFGRPHFLQWLRQLNLLHHELLGADHEWECHPIDLHHIHNWGINNQSAPSDLSLQATSAFLLDALRKLHEAK